MWQVHTKYKTVFLHWQYHLISIIICYISVAFSSSVYEDKWNKGTNAYSWFSRHANGAIKVLPHTGQHVRLYAVRHCE